MISVNEVLKVLLAFLPLIFVIAQLRIIKRIKSMKKYKEAIPGELFLAEALEGFCVCLQCCGEIFGDMSIDMYIDASTDSDYFKIDEEKKKKAIRENKEDVRQSKRAEERAERGYIVKEEDENKVRKLIDRRQKTRLLWITNVTKIPMDRVIEIISMNPEFMIEGEYVINKRLQTAEEEAIERWERKERTQEIEDRKKRITEGFCPECDNPLKPDYEYSSVCGCDLVNL